MMFADWHPVGGHHIDWATFQRGNDSTDAINIVIDVEGWFANSGLAIQNGQTQTHKSVTLQADPRVTYFYRVGTTGDFTTKVPQADVQDGNGNAPSAWPVQKVAKRVRM